MSKSPSFDPALNAEAPSGTGAPDADERPRIATASGEALKPAQADAQQGHPITGGFIRKS